MVKKTETAVPANTVSALASAQQLCDRAGERLTPARRTAYAELLAQDRPISAYELLALLEQRERRKLAPLTVYRALDFLIRVGLVHKIESRHAFLACRHPEDPHQGLYLVCSACGRADEVDTDAVGHAVDRAAKARGFTPERQIVEVQGLCVDCGETQER
jgi:Fur family transcriptional regulator, zinc uptake regulator